MAQAWTLPSTPDSKVRQRFLGGLLVLLDFIVTELGIADIISDYNAGDEIDLTEVLNVALNQGAVDAVVDYNSGTGVLSVDGGGGFQAVATISTMPLTVDVIVDDGLGTEQTFTVM